ncbi:L-threonylcarbamoyladenylate synthase [Halorubrum cibi]|uniref:L-threonylcarbamoyladenylate synthase n=1 Tax=Halorubrum cibi TaxID=413815 RepID=A0A521BCJ3_9EURY|nr:L-threonylcarbamoyladenylate synthase [Halorubrum cibi]SMO44816.1 L-threonylcarbamoyladenylate synthase [Halorubrum cibi]
MTDDADTGTEDDGLDADESNGGDRETLRRAADAVAAGELVVYPTETVYGLGADALDPIAVERAFETKGRDRDDPLSLGIASVDAASNHTRPTALATAFMRAFLPGPVTVVVERDQSVPDVLTGGRDRVGVRVPDHPVARALLEETGPLTATSANVSGNGSVTRVTDLDERVRDRVAAVIDGGETSGAESTVVDPENGTIHRRGAMAGAVEAWLADPPV